MDKSLSNRARMLGTPGHAGGTIATPQPSVFDRFLSIFRMKPSTGALGKASQTTGAPTSSEPNPYTYDGYDYVKRAAEEAGKRNEVVKGQGATVNQPSQPMKQHAAGTVASPMSGGASLGNYGISNPMGQPSMGGTSVPPSSATPPAPTPTPMAPPLPGPPPTSPYMGQPPMPGQPPVFNTGQTPPNRGPRFGRYPGQ